MTTKLIYHTQKTISDGVSPFVSTINEIVSEQDIMIMSPYFEINYLKTLLTGCRSWRMITDIDQWLKTISFETAGFVKKNTGSVRHMQDLNTRIIITKAHALVGLYDFTKQGILVATEMAVLLEDKNLVNELISWFNDTWDHSEDVKNYKMVLKKFMVRRINDMFP